jgi:transcriptional regulator with XRE-family HTH domain
VSRPTISNIENGKTSGIDLQVLEKLANALGVNAAVLIEHTTEKGKRG